MAKNHGARQQKKVAKQKAKRAEKRSNLFERSSNDPTIRLKRAEKCPVVQTLVSTDLWTSGIGYLIIARQESAEGLIFAVFLVDVRCLGVKDAFWRTGTPGELKELLRKIEGIQTMRPISPEALVKIITGAVAFARSFGFSPHPDHHHAALLLAGIDPATCPQEFIYGRDGKPFYVQGPHESFAQAEAITRRIQEARGHFLVEVPPLGLEHSDDFDDRLNEYDPLDEESDPDEWL